MSGHTFRFRWTVQDLAVSFLVLVKVKELILTGGNKCLVGGHTFPGNMFRGDTLFLGKMFRGVGTFRGRGPFTVRLELFGEL